MHLHWNRKLFERYLSKVGQGVQLVVMYWSRPMCWLKQNLLLALAHGQNTDLPVPLSLQ